MDEQNIFFNNIKFSIASFEAIAKTATDSIIISDDNSIIVFANTKTYEIFGYREGELIGLEMGILMPERYREAHRAGVTRYIDSGIPKLIGHTIEIEGLRKSGNEFPLELSLSSWKENNRCFFSGIIRDITQKKEILREKEDANLKLKEQQVRLIAAYEELQASQEELQASEEELMATNEELHVTSQNLKTLNDELEKRVHQRTLQLQQHKDWLQNLFMQVPALIGVLKGREGIVMLCNDMLSRLWGKRQVVGKPMREAWPELEGQGFFEYVESTYDSGQAVTLNEYPVLIDRKNNSILEKTFFNLIYAPYLDINGAIEGIIIYGEEVTEQIKARKVIEESAKRFRFMADAMPQKVWTAQADGNLNYVNQKWLDYTGLSFEKLKDWGWKSIIHPEDWPENEKVWNQSIETGNDFQLEHRLKRKGGQYRWHLSRGLAQRNDEGEINLWIGTNTDIHDQKIAQVKLLIIQEELEKSNKELKKINNDLDNFIYTASHDLKSPVSNLEGLITMAKKELSDKLDENNHQLLVMMETSINRLKNTIVDLAEITKIQKGTGEPPEKINFKEIIGDVKEDLSGELIKSGGVIVEKLEVFEIFYPKKDLRSILYNLLSNAIKYKSNQRALRIEIRTYKQNENLILSIRDNGVGLSEQQVPKLFAMFRRLHAYGEGTGIGLYIIKRIIENNGGQIKVKSKENKGTTFKVILGKKGVISNLPEDFRPLV